MGAAVAANGSEDSSLFLFSRPTTGDVIHPSRSLPAAMAFIHGRASSMLEDPASLEEIERYAAALPDREMVLVTPGEELPAGLPDDRFERRATIRQPIAFWEESHTERPDDQLGAPYVLSVWALRSS